ncbi:MAG: deoxynucleoside kinase [Bacteroidaceae bacterium]|nr:deoxynucleoside kinase [Bacteroidaceae bacterium]
MHIVVAGNIGSGKTTLTNLLARHYGWEPKFEAVSYNPYLEDYYQDIQRWAFNLEVYFLKERFKDTLNIDKNPKTIIQDRSIYEGVHVFAANNHKMGQLSDRDYATYLELFEQMQTQLRVPDLMIYLRADISHLVENIQKRGRDYEQTIQIEYLQGLNDLYNQFIYEKYPGRVLTVNVNQLDYLHRPEDFKSIIDRIDPLLYGLFPFNSPITPL